MVISEKPVYHIPALLHQCIAGLNINPEGVYVDVTFGGGGHSRAIMQELGEQGRLLAFDQDLDAWGNRIEDPRFTFVHSNFAYLKNFLRYHGITQVDGILADLGVSFHHFDQAERGFSFRYAEAMPDMRMNPAATVTARDILLQYSQEQLAHIFRLYGELGCAYAVARAIVQQRSHNDFATINQLLQVVQPIIGEKHLKKDLARLFQALRIEVNRELDVLERLLTAATEVLAPGGRLVVLTYHSLEDRLVKNFMRAGNTIGRVEKDFFGRALAPLKPVNNKVIVADDAEVKANPRARSAKLRIAQKL